MNDADKEAEDIVIKFSTDMDSCPTEIELECLRDSIADKLKSKQDEIDQYKKQWQNAEDSNIKLSEKILEYRKEIASLKQENQELLKTLQNNGKLECEAVEMQFDPKATASIVKGMKEEIERLTNKLREAEAEIRRLSSPLEVAKTLSNAGKEIQTLTARNKELEKQASPTIEGVPWYDFVSGLQKKISELESKLAVLEKNKTYYVYEGSDLEAFELNRLESKIAVAREALNCCKTTFDWEHFPEELEVINKALAELGEKP